MGLHEAEEVVKLPYEVRMPQRAPTELGETGQFMLEALRVKNTLVLLQVCQQLLGAFTFQRRFLSGFRFLGHVRQSMRKQPASQSEA